LLLVVILLFIFAEHAVQPDHLALQAELTSMSS